jgi:hypothetical protein
LNLSRAVQIHVGYEPEWDGPLVLWREDPNHVVPAFDLEARHETNANASKDRFFSQSVILSGQ